ncbi:HAD family hydrolase [Sphingomonas oligophenolica]|uniref:HAD family hydrolase n=1 Tax=Sphingomonas oligophenolica TaxID=301154 RepID=A0A502CNW8_9SPHN|nr:HAD family hydrolase [Sphingomonas oligophenolica]TPG14442.1 HAD family hydrolase [Sphingomonas oligophenolica]
MPVKLICLDADDTLWHNMRHFNAAEEAFAAILAPFAEAKVTREALAVREARNLPLYGYGAKSFTLSLIETAVELVPDAVSAAMIGDILAAGRSLLAHPVELFDDIAETLGALSARGRLVLVTKGDLLHQEAKLAASGLGEWFDGVEIVSDKTRETFTQLFCRHAVTPSEAVMAGDSMRSDIVPTLAAGAWAAYIPQEGAWSHEAADAPSGHPRLRQFDRLSELPAWIDTIA